MSSQIEQLGSMVSDWCLEFAGKTINSSNMEGWYDFSDPGQVIFGYPTSPGTYATIFPTQTDCGHHDIRIFLFVNTEDSKIMDVSYSVIMISPTWQGENLDVELFEPDLKKAKELIEDILI